MKSLDECIEFIQDEVALAHSDRVPETASGLEAALEYLKELEIIRGNAT